MAKITLNGIEREVEENSYLIRAAARCGVHIPHYCYHPALKVEGNCRMCSVEIEGVPKLQTACTTIVRDGMVVNTESEKVVKVRSEVMEFLLRNHPIDCPICDQAGECGLQDYYMEHGLHDSRVTVAEKVKKKKRVDLGPNVVLDSERCILCARCVRFCKDVTGTAELVIANRGSHAEITTFPGRPLTNDYAMNTVDLCPVGALTSRKFRFKCRVWFMERAESICPGCERGCNIYLDRFQNEIQRMKPRVNPRVNGYWICDAGRLDIDWINTNRLLRAEEGGRPIAPEESDREAASALSKGDEVLLVASPSMSNENLFALKKFSEKVLPGSELVGGSFREPWEDDGILRLPDRNPNRKGMEAIGIPTGIEKALATSRGTVLLFENDLLGDQPHLGAKLEGKKVIAFASNRTATVAAADLAVPVTSYAEMAGSFTNHAGRTQPFEPAIRPEGEARPVHEILHRIAAFLGSDLNAASFDALRSEMLEKVSALSMAVPDGREAEHVG